MHYAQDEERAIDRTVDVFIPRPGATHLAPISAGAAIVGARLPAPPDEVWVDYEEAAAGEGPRTFADRARLATLRHLTPERGDARMCVPRDELVRVGRYDPLTTWVAIAGEEGSARLAEWLGVPELAQGELVTTGPGSYPPPAA